MRVVAFNGSPHREGSTYHALRELCGALETQGVEAHIIHVGHAVAGGCKACYSCSRHPRHHCIIDDVLNASIDEALDADGLVFGSPVYYGGAAGGMRSFMDRFFTAVGSRMRGKPCACIAAARRAGTVETFLQMSSYPMLTGMLIVPSRYWGGVFGASGDQVLSDAEGMQHMRTMGVNMAWMLRMLEATRESVPLPVLEERIKTNFVR